MDSSRRKRVLVVGAGLSGLIAALQCADHGLEVVVCDRNSVAGGKCSARWNGVYYEEHAYHILPAWYVNLWALVDRVSRREDFIDHH
jgi:uncharacterized protein with NAD-binding domain and iron-sulfur cluster